MQPTALLVYLINLQQPGINTLPPNEAYSGIDSLYWSAL